MHARLRRPAVALITTTLAAGALGYAPAAQAAVITLSGTVTGSDTDSGLSGVDVTIYEYNTVDQYWESIDYTDTNADGDYFVALPDGAYRVGFSDWAGGHIAEYYANADQVSAATTVPVTSASPAVVDAVLDPGAHITGTVSGAGAGGLASMEVGAYEAVVRDGETYYDEVAYAVTNSNGDYDLRGLPSGEYVIRFRDMDYFDNDVSWAGEYYDDVTNAAEADPVAVTAPQTTPGINAVLAPDAQFSGTVANGSGTGVQGVVTAYSKVGQEWEYVDSTWTEPDGTYVFEGLRADTYRVEMYGWVSSQYAYEFWNEKGRVETADDVVLTAAIPLTGISATLVPGEHDDENAVQNTALPTISGAPVVGQTLTASTGSWAPTATGFYYDWLRDGEFIVGEYGSTYVPTAADVGKKITVLVSASADGYDDGHAESAPTAVVTAPVVTPPAPVATPPVVTPPAPAVDVPAGLAAVLEGVDTSGKPKVGKTIKVTGLDKLFRASTAVTYKFQWFAGKKAIKKATKSKLTITRAMKGKKVSVKVTARAGSTSKSVTLKVGKVT